MHRTTLLATPSSMAEAAPRVYCAGPPPLMEPPGSDDRPLRLRTAGRCVVEGSSESARDPMLRVYLSDMVTPYGLALRGDLLAAGSGQSYGEMAGALLTDMVRADQPVDLIVVAFAIHDVVPGRSTANYLSHLCPGSPMSFAICDQGAAAPFTGLRLLRAYTRTGGCRTALLVVVEQATLHYDCPAPAPSTAPFPAAGAVRGVVPARNAAVALLFGESGPGRLDTVRQHPDVGPAQLGDLLAGELAALSTVDTDITLVAGNGLAGAALVAGPAGAPASGRVVAAPAGQPCTGVWWELAGGLPGWREQGQRVLLADYDPALRYLCVSALDVDAGAEPASGPPRRGGAPARPAP